eukprot:CAMPEP_0118974310 /NCGR_PEP_ID=MMETSP1173-20130426/11186_1 /TAXON_ID=1034831 /ORGANISM="Rhizochromulina marina cf, Strain CCMP1243" /LENGTH=249 /DNA_ID=CAMNT_0006924027 /DNA_START=27 /DNA_END=773 /DNA_ORIENTATION=-
MASLEAAATTAATPAATMDEFRKDLPCISDAMKSFVSVVMARSLTAQEDHTPAPAGEPVVVEHRNAAGELVGSKTTCPRQPFSPSQYMACARAVLKHMNSFDATAAHPHPVDLRQEIALGLAAKVRLAECKVTKLFGRRFLVTTDCSQVAVDAARAELASDSLVPPELVDSFLSLWSSTVMEQGCDDELAELVWSKNLSSTLRQNQQKRLKEVKERKARMDTAEGDYASLRDMVVAGGGGAAGGGGTLA